jgi:hypothetical protein
MVIMVGASLLLWAGVPVFWLWLGSQVQASSGSLGLALLVMLVGAIGSIVAIAWVLGRMSRMHAHLRESQGLPPSETPLLEMVLVITATIAVAGFVFWFFIIAGPGPTLAPKN